MTTAFQELIELSGLAEVAERIYPGFHRLAGAPEALMAELLAKDLGSAAAIETVCTDCPTKKGAIFDVDGTFAFCFEVATLTNTFALHALANNHGVSVRHVLNEMHGNVPSTLITHDPRGLIAHIPSLSGQQYPGDERIIHVWERARDELFRYALFNDVKPVLQAIRDKGGLVYICTNSPQTSLLHRFHLWGLPPADDLDLVTAIFVRQDPPGAMAVHSQCASPDEAAYRRALLDDPRTRRVFVTDESDIKPNPIVLCRIIDHANDLVQRKARQDGVDYTPLTPRDFVMVGESPGSDGKCAHGAGMDYLLPLQGVPHNHTIRVLQQICGERKYPIGPDTIVKQVDVGTQPVARVLRLAELFDHFCIAPAFSPQEAEAGLPVRNGQGRSSTPPEGLRYPFRPPTRGRATTSELT